MTKTIAAILGAALAMAACEARAASSMAKRYEAGPAIQGNSDQAMPMHKKPAKHALHKKAM